MRSESKVTRKKMKNIFFGHTWSDEVGGKGWRNDEGKEEDKWGHRK